MCVSSGFKEVIKSRKFSGSLLNTPDCNLCCPDKTENVEHNNTNTYAFSKCVMCHFKVWFFCPVAKTLILHILSYNAQLNNYLFNRSIFQCGKCYPDPKGTPWPTVKKKKFKKKRFSLQDVKQEKEANAHFWEAGTREALVFFCYKFLKQLNIKL